MSYKSYASAEMYGRIVYAHSQREGAHNTPAAEEKNNLLSHIKGKYGEIAFLRWLLIRGFFPSHTPFRNDYTIKNQDDDFIVNGVRVEVKSKRRGSRSPFPPPSHYNVNLGMRTLEKGALYAFIEIGNKGTFEDCREALLLGWATTSRIEAVGRRVTPQSTSDNGNFSFQRYDWDIAIADLFPPDELQQYLTDRRDKYNFEARGDH